MAEPKKAGGWFSGLFGSTKEAPKEEPKGSEPPDTAKEISASHSHTGHDVATSEPTYFKLEIIRAHVPEFPTVVQPSAPSVDEAKASSGATQERPNTSSRPVSLPGDEQIAGAQRDKDPTSLALSSEEIAARDKQEQRAKEAAQMYPNGFPAVKHSDAVRYDTPWTLQDRWKVDIESYRYAEGQTPTTPKRQPDKYCVEDRAAWTKTLGEGQMYASGVQQAARIRLEDRRQIDNSVLESARQMRDDGQTQGRHASAPGGSSLRGNEVRIVDSLQPPISTSPSSGWITTSDAIIEYGDSTAPGSNLSVFSSPQLSPPRVSGPSESMNAEWYGEIARWNGQEADMRFKLLERESGGKVVQARKDSIFRTVREPGRVMKHTAEPQAQLYASYDRSRVVAASNNDNDNMGTALPAGVSGSPSSMRGSRGGRARGPLSEFAHGDLYGSPNSSYSGAPESSERYTTLRNGSIAYTPSP